MLLLWANAKMNRSTPEQTDWLRRQLKVVRDARSTLMQLPDLLNASLINDYRLRFDLIVYFSTSAISSIHHSCMQDARVHLRNGHRNSRSNRSDTPSLTGQCTASYRGLFLGVMFNSFVLKMKNANLITHIQ
jgi:hypothetical protein